MTSLERAQLRTIRKHKLIDIDCANLGAGQIALLVTIFMLVATSESLADWIFK